MTRFYLLDDDSSVTQILKIIIEEKGLGQVCGMSTSPAEALDDLVYLKPDIVLADLLMPEIDGISFVRKALKKLPDADFIMLSQVSAKEMIAKAYEAGVRYFIQKPINAIEVNSVIQNVVTGQNLQRTMDQMQSIFANNMGNPQERPQAARPAAWSAGAGSAKRERLMDVLGEISLIGENGCDDIIKIVEYYVEHEDELSSMTLKGICEHFSDSPKSMEQRIRRAAANGLSSIANMGIDDFANPTFMEYSSSVYNFEQVRKEMDYIQGKSDAHGNVKMKKFISALVSICNK